MLGLFDRVQKAAEVVRRHVRRAPRVGIVLGSGMGALAERLSDAVRIPYGEIPEFPTTSVAGHAGELVVGALEGVDVAVLRGRIHYYEGHDLATVTLPVRVLSLLGVTELILTAAAGGIRPELQVGDLVLVSDHINMMGENPLRGVNDERLGHRFVDLTEVYSARLRDVARRCAPGLGFSLAEGVYVAMPGPSYETPAEIRMVGMLGGSVVGMSTVPEAIVARQCGLDVLALALVTNAAAGVTEALVSHEEVLAVSGLGADRLGSLIERIVGALSGERA